MSGEEARRTFGIPANLSGIEVKAPCRLIKFFYTHLGKPCFMDLALGTVALS